MAKREIIPSNTNLKSADNNKDVNDICTKFKNELMRCVNCPILMQCTHPQKRLTILKEDAQKMADEIYDEEIELDDSADNKLRAQQKRDYTYKAYIENRAYDVLKDERCVFERREILKVLEKFVNAGYDMSDPRSNLVIQELLGNILNSGRANKAFTSLGVILKKETAAGPVYYQNPLLKTKMEFSKLIIEATEALDRMLKSDETTKAENNFTEHLLRNLKLKDLDRNKTKVIDSFNDD